ncbi:MAG: anti-sigma factor, partial [Nocardioides sp.]
VVAVIGGGIVWQQTRDDSRDNARDREQVQVLTAEERILQAPDAARERLTFPGGAAATLVRSASQHRALLITEAMPPAPDGSVYQVWFDVPGEGMVAAAVMPPRPDQTVLLSGDAAVATAAGITVEPTGGSVTPTSETIALFDFDNLTPVGGTDAT